MKALLIIDMQKGSFTPATPRFETKSVVRRINQLSETFRRNGDLVVFIQHDGSRDGNYIPGSEEWELHASLETKPGDLIVPKTANDSFYKTPLKEILSEKKVDELVVTGCATDFCVDATIKSALINDFNITVISDGHTTADRQNMEARNVINYFNWLWAEMIPTGGRIKVVDTTRYLNSLTYYGYE